jgi:hypothetical protein
VPRAKPLAREDLTVAEIDGEAVVFDPVPSKLHFLNHSAALIFGLCDGQTTIAEMSGAIAEAYDLDPHEVDGQIRPLLRQFQSSGMLGGKGAERVAARAAADAEDLRKLQRIPLVTDS